MKTTANFKLKKPDLTDVADIEVLNSNSDILDKIIKDLQNSQFTEQQARQIFALISHRHNTSDINNLTTAIQQTKVNSAAYADNANRLDNLDSTDFMRANKGDGTLANDLGVAQYIRWKNYGQHHVIFDASQGTTPSGRSCDRHNSENNYYSANCPNLMGWNGHQTYGLGVDRARTAEQVQGFQFRNNNGRLEVLVNGVWLQVGGRIYNRLRDYSSSEVIMGAQDGIRNHYHMGQEITLIDFHKPIKITKLVCQNNRTGSTLGYGYKGIRFDRLRLWIDEVLVYDVNMTISQYSNGFYPLGNLTDYQNDGRYIEAQNRLRIVATINNSEIVGNIHPNLSIKMMYFE